MVIEILMHIIACNLVNHAKNRQNPDTYLIAHQGNTRPVLSANAQSLRPFIEANLAAAS